VRRREFIAALGAAAAGLPMPASSQQRTGKMQRVGVLLAYSESDSETQAHVAAFREQLRRLGWTLDRDIQIDCRWTGGDAERIVPLAAELVALHPDVLVGRATPVAAALLQETRKIPVVFVNVSDPVGDGLVQSIARPGGNATGFTSVEASLGGKWLGLLKEIVPGVARIAVMFNPKTAGGAGGAYYLRLVKDAAASIAVEAVAAPVQDDSGIKQAIAEFARAPNGVLVVLPDITTTVHRGQIIALAGQYRLPAMYPYRYDVKEGGLLSYGVDLAEMYRQAATYVDRILRGAKPDDLPVQQPTKFELVINLKTAKALGLEIPPTLLARADEVIE
jgi:putative tryptophan/tyrosine transport system substrate-binding protein